MTRPAAPPDWRVLDQVTSEPQILYRFAKALDADVFDVEASLKRLLVDGSVVYHAAGPGIQAKWSLAGQS